MIHEYYTCDHCENKSHNKPNISLEVIGDGNLSYKNQSTSLNQKISLENYTNLHFCSQSCFINFFFNCEDGKKK